MEPIMEKWDKVLDDLAHQVPAIGYDMWIKKLTPIEIKNGKLLLKSTHSAGKTVCHKSYGFVLSSAISQHFGIDEFEVLTPDEYYDYLEQYNLPPKPVVTEVQNITLNPKFTFDNFVVGKSNEFVYSAVLSVAENPGTRFNPLFIYGGVGLGKTHLLHAIGNHIHKNMPDKKLLYCTCEQFTNDYLSTLSDKSRNISSFREKYRNVDVLLVDDIQFIGVGDKKSTQEEFFNTFNDLCLNNKQVIISSDRPPKEIPTLTERLRSRFGMGLIHDIQQPDFETRFVILQKKVQLLDLSITVLDETLIYIAENVTSNIRELEGALNNTVYLTELLGKNTAGIEEAKEAIKGIAEQAKSSVDAYTIIDKVATFYHIDRSTILGTKRNKEIAEARHVAIYLIADLLNMPLATIGREIFSRDHTSIMHAKNKIADNLTTNKRLANDIDSIKALIYKK